VSKFIAFTRYGELEVHALDPQGKTDTLCGCDGHDSHEHVGTNPATLPDNPKITCKQCWMIVSFSRRYDNADFTKEVRRA
jgi:hypothetical protein